MLLKKVSVIQNLSASLFLGRNQNSASFEQYEVHVVIVIFSVRRNWESETLDRLSLICALLGSKIIHFSRLSASSLHGGTSQRWAQLIRIFHIFSSPIDTFHTCVKIRVDFPWATPGTSASILYLEGQKWLESAFSDAVRRVASHSFLHRQKCSVSELSFSESLYLCKLASVVSFC